MRRPFLVFMGCFLLFLLHPGATTGAGEEPSGAGPGRIAAGQATPDISGRWTSNVGLVYEITVTGSDFTWKETRTGQIAKGRIDGLSVTASWRGLLKQASATGTVTVDEFGRAVKIAWSNNVVFSRPPDYFKQAPPAGPTPSSSLPASIAGRWNSNVGLVFTVSQQGNRFAWTLAGLGQQAEGEILGDSLKVTWTDRSGGGTATGKLVRDGTGVPMRVEWSNGIVFLRPNAGTPQPQPPSQPEVKAGTESPARGSAEAVAPSSLETAAWHREAALRLRQSSSVGDSRLFLAEMGDVQSIRRLSGSTGLPPKELLFLANELELRGLIGENGATPSEWAMLKELGLETLPSLKRYANRPEILETTMANLARHKNLPPPDPAHVRAWLQAAATKASSVARSETVLKRSSSQPVVNLTPLKIEKLETPAGPGTQPAGGFKPLVAKALGSFDIPPGKTEYVSEFAADEPGLYRAKVTFNRLGGAAVLGWRIERPRVVLRSGSAPVLATPQETVFYSKGLRPPVQTVGYETLVQGKQPLQQVTDNWVYFYVKPSSLPVANRLSLRLTVRQNQDQKDAVKDVIEQMDPNRKSDPTIRGSVEVQRTKPLKLATFNEKVKFPAVREAPLYAVETPLYQAARGQFQMPQSIVLVVAHDPQEFARQFPSGSVDDILAAYPAQGNPGQLPNVLRNESIVNGVQTYHERYQVVGNQKRPVPFRGVDVLRIDSPQEGVYSFLVGADSPKASLPSFGQLAAEGFVYSHWEPDPQPCDARVLLQGGQVPKSVYVMELESLQVSDQSESGDDDNDEGLGEFQVAVNSLLSTKNPYEGVEGFQSPKSFYRSWSLTYPDEPDWLLPDPLYIRPSNDGQQNICFPKMPIASFSEEDATQADVFTTVVNVVEDDDFSWWDLNEGLVSLVEGIVKVFISALGQDYKGAVKGFLDVVTFDQSQLVIDEVDDKIGFPVFTTGRPMDWGLRGSRYALFESKGPAKLEFRDTETVVNEAGDVIGSVTKADDTPSARATISARKRLAPFSWARVDLKEFTLRPGNSGPGEDVDVIVRRGHIQYRTLTTKYGKDVFKPLPGEAYSTFYGQWTEALNLRAKTGQPMVFPVSAPPKPGLQDLVENPYTYIQWEFLEDLPGSDALLGNVSFTLYHEDFYRAVVLKEDPFGDDPYGSLSQGGVLAKYSKQGPFYVGEFTLRDPGTWLESVKIVAYVYIHE